ncbi:MAG TPA: hypothetical protein VND21_00015 [Planctomycetota bacterium]|nr:hypothetical protein [Planctomycetota bacterium]
MSDAVLAEYPSRMQGEMVVQVLSDERIPAVVFVDVARGHQGEILYERAAVHVRLGDLERARSVLEAWNAARAQGIDVEELERQALEAGGARAEEAAVEEREVERTTDDANGTRGIAGRGPAWEDRAETTCPHCRAAVAEGLPGRVRRAVAALVGRTSAPRGERLCLACGHRWTPGDGARG